MTAFWQVLAGVLISVVMGLALSKQGRDITLLMSIAVCCMVLLVAVSYLKPVLDFVNQLKTVGNLDNNLLKIMLKAVGIGLIAEIATLICNDSGNSALGKTVQILASAVLLWLAIPLMGSLLELVQKIVGEV